MTIFERYYIPIHMDKLAKEVDFHDSIITNVEYDHNSFCTIVSLQFCNWRQLDYKNSEPEVIDLFLEFTESFLLIDSKIKFDDKNGGIYRVESVDSRTLKIFFESGLEDEPVGEMTIISDGVYLRKNKPSFDSYNAIMAESEHYAIKRFYEGCHLIFKDMKHESISVGDFYGDAEFAFIDKNERFVVAGGCGLVIYRLKEPFDFYRDENYKTDQYIVLGLEGDPHTYMYYDSIEQIGDNKIKITDANGDITEYEFEL